MLKCTSQGHAQSQQGESLRSRSTAVHKHLDIRMLSVEQTHNTSLKSLPYSF